MWDIFLLEGDKILSAMAYCLLKLHRNQLYALGMDDILNFLQVSIIFSVNFSTISVTHTKLISLDYIFKCS